MKLQPVYLCPPKPDTRVKLSRRAFWGAVLGATAVGVTGGYTARHMIDGGDLGMPEVVAATSSKGTGTTSSKSPKVTRRLAWAREFAESSDERLCGGASSFVATAVLFHLDPIVGSGLRRVARLINAKAPVESALAVKARLLGLHAKWEVDGTSPLTPALVEGLRN